MGLDYNVSSGPFLSYEIEIGDGPGPDLTILTIDFSPNDKSMEPQIEASLHSAHQT